MESSAGADTHVCDKESMVDPFLVEALQNPRHRLTILRMELDIQKFLQNPDQQQFEFQHFPTSYLRLAAHRVAQHYGLVTTVLESGLVDGSGNRILVLKNADRKNPFVQLSEIPAKQSESDKVENVKIAIKPRPCKGGSARDANDLEKKRGPMRSVEERIEEYDRARARIFNNSNSLESDDSSSELVVDGKNTSPSRDEMQEFNNTPMEAETNFSLRENNSYRVAILRDREKDRFDPDYDRSYQRYVRSLRVNQNVGLAPFNLQNAQPQLYDRSFPQFGQAPTPAASISYSPHGNIVMNPYCTMGLNQRPGDAMYMWPNAVMYAHPYDQFRHAPLQAQYCQQPLSFDYSQNR